VTNASTNLDVRWASAVDTLRHGLHGCSTADECRLCIRSGLATEDRILERNTQISSSYAALYLRHPILFKWSGMAAFASQHVRKLLWLKASSERDHASAAMLSRLMSIIELETIREINNAIPDDVFWAHLLYDGCEDGAARVTAMVQGTTMEPLAEEFAPIDTGRKRLEDGDEGGRDTIVLGNITLLRYEQESVVQPHLSRLSCTFARGFSLGSSLNYEPKGIIDCLRYCSSFYAFMLLRKWVRLVRSRSLPRLDLLEHRWAWIERVLLPKFIALEQRAAAAKIRTIRDADPSQWLSDFTIPVNLHG
jgi:hypothetical protein